MSSKLHELLSRELCEESRIEGMLELEDPRDIGELEKLILLEDPRERHVGFTGTKNGMQPNQKLELVEYLRYLKAEGYTHFHHGDCIGSDAQAAKYAKALGFVLVCHPGHPKDKSNTMYRAFTEFNDVMHEAKPFAVRDRDIVDAVETMIATPAGSETRASGTWTTVRYARRKEKPVHTIYPKKEGT